MKAAYRKVLQELLKKRPVRLARSKNSTTTSRTPLSKLEGRVAHTAEPSPTPKARWCKRTSKNARRVHGRILATARKLREEIGLPPSPHLADH